MNNPELIELLKRLRKDKMWGGFTYKLRHDAADLLERLARENRNLRSDCAAFDALIESRGKRIEELEIENKCLKFEEV